MRQKPNSGADPDEIIQRAIESTRLSGMRWTKPREVLLRFLLEEHGPFTIEEINKTLRKHSLDLVTIYRCLSAFERMGYVRRCDFGDGVARYEFQDLQGHHHHHVICTDCKQTENIEDCALPRIEKKVAKMGYSNVRHSLEFFGRCRSCQAK